MTTVAEFRQYLERFDGNARLEVVLQHEEARPFFKKLYASLQPIFGQSEPPHQSRFSLARRLEIRDRVLYEYQSNPVKSNPETVWESFASRKSPWSAHDSPDTIVGKVYAACREFPADRERQTKRWRLLTLFFYLLARRPSSTSNVSDRAKCRLLEAINRSGLVVPNPTEEDIEELVSTGGRYVKLCREWCKTENGLGSLLNDQYRPLFLLPRIDGSIWEDRRKLQGDEFNTGVRPIYRLDVMERTETCGASSLVKAILEVAFRPFTDTRLHWPSEQLFYRYPITIPYDSPIFVCVQNGDVGGMRELFQSCQVPIDVVDPYGLGLLHYGTYYCWRNSGMEFAMTICQALLDAGANPGWIDNDGNTPMDTMTDFILVEAAMNGQQPFRFLLDDLCRLFGQPKAEFWNEYIRTREFTKLHEVLLGTSRSHGTLNDYLAYAAGNGSLARLIDAPDALGRSALAWAVEYGWTEAVTTLVGFGANVNQRTGLGLPLLHQALAGPANGRLDTEFLNIVKTLLLAGADANSADHEGWTPLHIAASWNSQRGVETLIAYAREPLDWMATTNDGKSAAQLAEDAGGDPALSQFLLKASHM